MERMSAPVREAARTAPLHLERDVVDLEVEKDAQAALAHGVHDGGALRVEERHAHLDPGGLAGEQIRQLERALP